MTLLRGAARHDGRVRRIVTLAAAWLIAAAVAVAIAWNGVGIVTRQVTDDRPASLDPDEVRELAGAAAAPTTTLATAPTTEPAPAAGSATTRTYNTVGGSAALRFTPEGVTVLWATPHAGFDVEVEVERDDGDGVRVEFESDSHRSRVEGRWAGGPKDRVREQAR